MDDSERCEHCNVFRRRKGPPYELLVCRAGHVLALDEAGAYRPANEGDLYDAERQVPGVTAFVSKVIRLAPLNEEDWRALRFEYEAFRS